MRITSLGHHIAVTMTNPCGLLFEAFYIIITIVSSGQNLKLLQAPADLQ